MIRGQGFLKYPIIFFIVILLTSANLHAQEEIFTKTYTYKFGGFIFSSKKEFSTIGTFWKRTYFLNLSVEKSGIWDHFTTEKWIFYFNNYESRFEYPGIVVGVVGNYYPFTEEPINGGFHISLGPILVTEPISYYPFKLGPGMSFGTGYSKKITSKIKIESDLRFFNFYNFIEKAEIFGGSGWRGRGRPVLGSLIQVGIGYILPKREMPNLDH